MTCPTFLLGVHQSQVGGLPKSQMGDPSPSGGGTTVLGKRHPCNGVPHPHPRQDWGTPLARTVLVYLPLPPRTGLGTSSSQTITGQGYPSPSQDRIRAPPLRQNSIASTCYAAGSMPLTFTEEDFLVYLCFQIISHRSALQNLKQNLLISSQMAELAAIPV